MCLLSDAELYCVSTNVRRMSELMQFESAMSTSRYLPPSGTAGFDRCCVSGKRRLPAPPPRITANSFGFAGIVCHQQQEQHAGSACRTSMQEQEFILSPAPVRCPCACSPRGFLCDLYTHTGADARRAGLDHLACVVESFDASGRFNAKLRSDGASHQRDVCNSRSAF